MFTIAVGCLVFFIKLTEIGADLGDTCVSKRGQTGECTFLYQCRGAIKLIKQGITPTPCGFEGNDGIVCCIKDQILAKASLETSSGISRQRVRRQSYRNPGRDGNGYQIYRCSPSSMHVRPGMNAIICEERPMFPRKPIVHPEWHPPPHHPQHQTNSCKLPNNNIGECQALADCPRAASLFTQGIHPVVCGRTQTEVYVCCEIENNKPQPQPPPNQHQEESCTFPNSEVGVCLPSFKCSWANQWFPSVYCGNRGQERICCRTNQTNVLPNTTPTEVAVPYTTPPYVETVPTATEVQATSSRTEPLVHILPNLRRNDPCRLSNSENGTCLFAFQCPSALEDVSVGVIPDLCGYEGPETLICCKYNASYFTTTTEATQLRTKFTTSALMNLHENDPCKLSSGEYGLCLYTSQCPSALEVILDGVVPEVCGYQSSEALVCCKSVITSTLPVITSTTQLTTTASRTTIASIQPTTQTPELNENEQCTLLSGEVGLCLLTSQCPSALEVILEGIIPEVCGHKGSETLVCCKNAITTAITPTVPTVQTTTTMLPNLHKNDPCKLSSGEDGFCLNTFQCPSALENILSGIEPDLCGKDGKEVLICCKNSEFGMVKTEGRMQVKTVSEKKCIEYSEEVEKFTESKIINTPLVIGGKPSSEKEFPHMAALGYGTIGTVQWLCGGSLISPNFIVTAAHCTNSQELGQVRFARMGLLNLKRITNNLQDFLVTQIYKHPEHHPPLQYNDIALLKLNKDADFTEYVKPACLFTAHDVPPTKAYATGWGKTQFNGESSEALMKVDLKYFTFEQCKEAFATASKRKLPNGILDESQVCAGGVNEQKDTCQGDSGGPLQSKIEFGLNKPYIIGITSFGKACGIPNTPAVYTRVSYFVPWIEKIVWPNN